MDALARILRDYAGPLGRLVDSYERNATARQDLLQEIVVALVHAWPQFRGECSERTFVYRVAHNRAITHRTRRPPPSVSIDAAVEVSDPRPSPETLALQGQERSALRSALAALPVSLRQPLLLALEGLSAAEIGDVLGLRENNVAVRLTRARQALARALATKETA